MKEEATYSNSWRPMIGWVTLAQFIAFSGITIYAGANDIELSEQTYDFMKWLLGGSTAMATAYIAARSYDKKNKPKVTLEDLVKTIKKQKE